MNKATLRIIILIISIFFIGIIYLSTVGIKTNKLNNQISNKIKNFDENLDLQLKDVSVVLIPLKMKLSLKTFGTNLIYKKETIEIEKITSSISIKSLINNEFSLKELEISTKSIEIKRLISFIRIFNKDPKLYIAEKIVKKGFVIADIYLEFNENGNIKENYKIDGLVKDGKIDFLKK